MNPKNGVWVASLSHKMKTLKRANIVLSDKLSFIVLLFNDSHCCRSQIKGLHLILFNNAPQNTRVREDRLALKQNCSSASNQWTIDDKAVANYPAYVTARKPNVSSAYIENVLHCPVESHYCASSISHYTLGCPSCTRCVYRFKNESFHLQRIQRG